MIKELFNSKERRKTILWFAIILFSALLLLMVFNFLFTSSTGFIRLLNWSDPTKYQAIFLSNGQVYFGKISDVNNQTIILEDIYYLHSSGDIQSELESDNFSLIKLGEEIHGPEDRMNVNIDHVMFVEDLKDDSKIIKAIEDYRAK